MDVKAANQILVSIKIFSNHGVELFKQVIKSLQEDFKISKLSSVYRVKRKAESLISIRDIRSEEELNGLTLVIEATTDFSPQETLNKLMNIELKHQKGDFKRSVSINLLIYGAEVIMRPGLALPHPEFHLRPEEIVSAAEILPNYYHPVLNKTLFELAGHFSSTHWGEFVYQGPRLLDL